MNKRVLIVEDHFVEANNLQLILERAGYSVCPIARSVPVALRLIDQEHPDLVLIDIFLKGKLTGIDLAKILRERKVAFVYLSANSDKETLTAAKATRPYGFLVKPFREKDILVMLDVADYLHTTELETGNKDRTARASNGQRSAVGAPEDKPLANIIGKGKAIRESLNLVRLVAPSDTSVLVLGESGTGKELIAEAIHLLSKRRNKPLIKVNCAALPSTLIESELFGHEKGAFTGAFERRIGKFEQASGGTLLLDEIGEVPLEAQLKLLRVLQENEIERIGGNTVIPTDVRIIAATNKDLDKEVADRRFRLDLYYRLNVFPILLAPLQDRKEDIPDLIQHFVKRHAEKSNKHVTGVSDKLLRELIAYHWPGNIRQLSHFIERAVLLATENTISDASLLRSLPRSTRIPEPTSDQIKTMDENERINILAALRQSGGKVFGAGGAAELLSVSVSTLNSRIKKLGIEKETLFYK